MALDTLWDSIFFKETELLIHFPFFFFELFGNHYYKIKKNKKNLDLMQLQCDQLIS